MTHPKILHIANWFPNPWEPLEGIFVKEQISLFNEVVDATVVNVQVRHNPSVYFKPSTHELANGAKGYYIETRLHPGKGVEIFSTLLLLWVLLRERVWRFDLLHFHIAYPLLTFAHLWKYIFRKPILISEHWSAYHFNFYLPKDSEKLRSIQRIFQQGFKVITVSEALSNDIRSFAKLDHLDSTVIPNVLGNMNPKVSTHRLKRSEVVTFFSVNIWRDIKNPVPMIQGLICAAKEGLPFRAVIGGLGPLYPSLKELVQDSGVAEQFEFPGRMSKREIFDQLNTSDAYLFNSKYETFSVACAEALVSGVPLIGPKIAAIAEYTPPEAYFEIQGDQSQDWLEAYRHFLRERDSVHSQRISDAVRTKFLFENIQSTYLNTVREIL